MIVRQYTFMGEPLSSRVEAGLLPQQVSHHPHPLAQSLVSASGRAVVIKPRLEANLRGDHAIKQSQLPFLSSWNLLLLQKYVLDLSISQLKSDLSQNCVLRLQPH